MSKKTIITGILALVIGFGIGAVIPVAANSSFKIDSIEEARAIVEGSSDKKESDMQTEFAKDEVAEKETIQNSEEVATKEDIVEVSETEEAEEVTEQNESNKDNDISLVAKDSGSNGDGSITFDFNPDDIRVFGYELRQDIIEKICKDYNIPEGIESADKELDDGNVMSVYHREQEVNDKTETQDSISIHNSDYTKYFSIAKTEYDKPDSNDYNYVSITIGGDELVNDVNAANEFVGKYLEVPFTVINEEELECIFHVREIVDPLGLKNVEKVPVESNYEGTKLSEYNGSFHTVTLFVGNYEISAARQVDKTDNYYIFAKYVY